MNHYFHGQFDPRLVIHNGRYTCIPLHGNLHENLKSFCLHAKVFLEGLYSRYDHKDRVAALLLWIDDKGFHLYDSIEWGTHDKEIWTYVLLAFKEHFKPCQPVMQSWYQLGSSYSSNCKNQTGFVMSIKEILGEDEFKEKDEVKNSFS